MKLQHLGLVKTTLLDFPGEVAAAVFTPGCNLRCPYCHNPELIAPPYPDDLMSIEEIRTFLIKRANVLGGVCITGGEPLLYSDLYEFIGFCKSLKLKVKLDTNGCFPDRIDTSHLDYIAMDIKTVPEQYCRVMADRLYNDDRKQPAGAINSAEQKDTGNIAKAVKESIKKIITSEIPHEFRTTMVQGIAEPEDVYTIAKLLKSFYDKLPDTGNGKYVLTQFRPTTTFNQKYQNIRPYSTMVMRTYADQIRKWGITCEVRAGS